MPANPTTCEFSELSDPRIGTILNSSEFEQLSDEQQYLNPYSLNDAKNCRICHDLITFSRCLKIGYAELRRRCAKCLELTENDKKKWLTSTAR
ncbi:hypothetical protein T02_15317 [Trichinella nativa]|uniref:Uncharacterized protein n=1 Tax=Trichinella nativa TaxID=6335 RepID=A0A0V1LPG6_9BILA|nr:hypothetical protein T02_15317 [Trichinella nativa]